MEAKFLWGFRGPSEMAPCAQWSRWPLNFADQRPGGLRRCLATESTREEQRWTGCMRSLKERQPGALGPLGLMTVPVHPCATSTTQSSWLTGSRGSLVLSSRWRGATLEVGKILSGQCEKGSRPARGDCTSQGWCGALWTTPRAPSGQESRAQSGRPWGSLTSGRRTSGVPRGRRSPEGEDDPQTGGRRVAAVHAVADGGDHDRQAA